jgi:peptidoglycan hydrolase CwlO-like protein
MMMMKKKIFDFWSKFNSVILSPFKKTYDLIPENYRNMLKDIFAVVGVISSFYFILFFSISKPKMIEESEKKVEVLKTVIKENNKEIKLLHKENEKIEDEVEDLEKNLSDLQDKSDKYKKQYEKQVNTIFKLNNNELSELFTETFINYSK